MAYLVERILQNIAEWLDLIFMKVVRKSSLLNPYTTYNTSDGQPQTQGYFNSERVSVQFLRAMHYRSIKYSLLCQLSQPTMP